MAALIYIAETISLTGAKLRDELAAETEFDVRAFTSVQDLRNACAVESPDAVLVSCRQSVPEALPFLHGLPEGSAGIAMTPLSDIREQECAIALLGPLRVVTIPWQRQDLLPKLHAALKMQRLARDLKAAQHDLAKRNIALQASKRYGDRTNEALQAKHSVLETTTARLVEAEQLAAVGRVVTGIAHEISNQLAVVGYAEAIKSRVSQDSELYEFADAIAVAQRRLATMVDQIRTFTDPSDPDTEQSGFEPASLAAVVDEALSILRYDKEVRNRQIERVFTAHPLVSMKREQFDQVVINLVSNAAIATSSGDTIRVELKQDDERQLAILIVEDTGQGMPESVLKRLGEPFFTTRGHRSSGLGVGICMSIAKAHGGSIEYVSEVGVGTKATVLLPLFREDLV